MADWKVDIFHQQDHYSALPRKGRQTLDIAIKKNARYFPLARQEHLIQAQLEKEEKGWIRAPARKKGEVGSNLFENQI